MERDANKWQQMARCIFAIGDEYTLARPNEVHCRDMAVQDDSLPVHFIGFADEKESAALTVAPKKAASKSCSVPTPATPKESNFKVIIFKGDKVIESASAEELTALAAAGKTDRIHLEAKKSVVEKKLMVVTVLNVNAAALEESAKEAKEGASGDSSSLTCDAIFQEARISAGSRNCRHFEGWFSTPPSTSA